MNLPRRRLLQLASAAIATPAIAQLSWAQLQSPAQRPSPPPAPASAAFRLVEPLEIKMEEIQQSTNLKGALFGSNEDDQDGNKRGRSLLWRLRGEARDIAWQLAEVSVAVFRRPSPNIAPLDVTLRFTAWSRGYESLVNRAGGCYLEVVLLNKLGLVLNHLPLRFAGFDIRCQLSGNNLILPPLTYQPLDNNIFDDISRIQLFDRGSAAYPDIPYIRAFPCRPVAGG